MVTVNIWREARISAIRKGDVVLTSPATSSATTKLAMECTVPLKKAVP